MWTHTYLGASTAYAFNQSGVCSIHLCNASSPNALGSFVQTRGRLCLHHSLQKICDFCIRVICHHFIPSRTVCAGGETGQSRYSGVSLLTASRPACTTPPVHAMWRSVCAIESGSVRTAAVTDEIRGHCSLWVHSSQRIRRICRY